MKRAVGIACTALALLWTVAPVLAQKGGARSYTGVRMRQAPVQRAADLNSRPAAPCPPRCK